MQIIILSIECKSITKCEICMNIASKVERKLEKEGQVLLRKNSNLT